LSRYAKPAGAVIEERPGIALICVLRQHHETDPGVLSADCTGGLDALHTVAMQRPDTVANVGQSAWTGGIGLEPSGRLRIG
jgi:hypothetical protein